MRLDPAVLDELAANATARAPAQVVDGWWLRAAPDLPFRRSNAVVPLRGATPPRVGVDERIGIVERFYRERGLAPRFQVSPASAPADLDGLLEARGYVVDAPVDVLVASTAVVSDAVDEGADFRARVDETVDLRWVDAYAGPTADREDTRTRARLHAYRRLLAGITPRSVAVTVDDDAPVAVGLGVLERGHVGIFGMATRSDRRRRGAGRAVLAALARWALDQRAAYVYLQVETDNEAARSLYESVGFEHNHSYHYRVLT